MGKKKNKGQKNNNSSLKVDNLDERIIAKEIIYAYEEIERIKRNEEERQKEILKDEWNEILGYKNYPIDESWLKRKGHIFRNDIVGIFRLLFIKSNKVKEMRATFGLMKAGITMVFKCCKWLLYIFSLSILCVSITQKSYLIWGMAVSLAVWMLARLFRIAIFEIDKLTDENMLVAIFSATLSFVTIIIPVITFLINTLLD